MEYAYLLREGNDLERLLLELLLFFLRNMLVCDHFKEHKTTNLLASLRGLSARLLELLARIRGSGFFRGLAL